QPRAPGPPQRDALEDVLERLFAHPADAQDLLRAADRLQAIDRVDAQAIEEQLGRPGAEPADLEQAEEARGHTAAQGFELGDASSAQVFVDARGQVAPRARRASEAAGRGA